MPQIRRYSPLITLAVLVAFLFYGLQMKANGGTPDRIAIALPTFANSDLYQPDTIISEQQWLGHPSIIHVWASWCRQCHDEHHQWLTLSDQVSVPLYAINYKDDLTEAQDWLAYRGNPFDQVLFDPNGNLSERLGVAGTPETYVLDAYGTIILRHRGPISPEWVQSTLLPLLSSTGQEVRA